MKALVLTLLFICAAICCVMFIVEIVQLVRINRKKIATKEEIARSAATVWCRCWKCDGIRNDTGSVCSKPNCTCRQWYDGYRTTKIALDKAWTKIDAE